MPYVRPDIEALEGYEPGEQPRGKSFIKLNTNENPFPPSPRVAEAIAAATRELRLYSDPLSTDLREAAAKVYGLSPEQVIAGNGSDDILNLLIRLAVPAGACVASFSPSYTLYPTLAAIQGARFRPIAFTEDYEVPERLDLEGVRILFLANPNSPSGTWVGPETVRRLCRSAPGLVVADEAYADFARGNALALLGDCENLVITRSLSKSHSLAGLRVGLGLASAAIIRELLKVKDSYNLDRLAQAGAAAALRDPETLRKNTSRILATRRRFTAAIQAMGCSVYPSEANFVLARLPSGGGAPSAKEVYQALKERGILVRYFEAPRLSDSLRISIGTDPDMDTLVAVLDELLGASGRG
ncbi:MAG: histidinol-phosphate transaminase [Planctomycetota bacterium]